MDSFPNYRPIRMIAKEKEKRDLSFHDIEKSQLSKLSAEQIDFYNKEGYLRKFSAYSKDEAFQIRTYFDGLIERFREHKSDVDTYAINGYHTKCSVIHNIALNKKILDVVEDIVGPNFVCWGSHFFCKQANDPKKVAWHQDASYWPFDKAQTVTVWLAVEDVNIENSAMKFLPGTHRIGHMRWKDVKGPAVLNQEIQNIEKYGEPIHNELNAGEFSVHADMLAHGSEANTSSRTRCGLTLRYCPTSVRAINPGWGRNAILCRGSDPNNNWNFPSKPETHWPTPEQFKEHAIAIGAN